MSLFPDFDWIGCVLIGIVILACGVVYFVIMDKVKEFTSAIEDADPQYKIPENAEYGTFVEQGRYPHPLDKSKGYSYSGLVESSERIIGVDMASGEDVGVSMVLVEETYLEFAGSMLDEHGRLKGFWNELASYMFDHLDMDGGTFQDLGVKHGLLIEAAYNPEIHGDIDTEVGDTIFINPLQEDDSATADDKD